MDYNSNPVLTPLSETALNFVQQSDDIRGYDVMDATGTEMGVVEDLLLQVSEQKVQYLQVKSGGILGMGATRSLIPTGMVVQVGERTVHIDLDREMNDEVPVYNPELSDGFNDTLYRHHEYAVATKRSGMWTTRLDSNAGDES